jgi:hypothetical protein
MYSVKIMIRVVEYDPGYHSWFQTRKSYMGAIMHEDVYKKIRPSLKHHGIQHLIQSEHSPVPRLTESQHIELEQTCCFVTMAVGRTNDVIQLPTHHVYVMLWNTYYPSIFCFFWKPRNILSKLQHILAQVKEEGQVRLRIE